MTSSSQASMKCLPLKGSSGIAPLEEHSLTTLSLTLQQADPSAPNSVRQLNRPRHHHIKVGSTGTKVRGLLWWRDNSWKGSEKVAIIVVKPCGHMHQDNINLLNVLKVTDDCLLPSPGVSFHYFIDFTSHSTTFYTTEWLNLLIASQWGFVLVALFFIIIASTHVLFMLL